jgi:hypothetical protein
MKAARKPEPRRAAREARAKVRLPGRPEPR